ncbi:thymidine phosphorylase [Oscillospiraceae bacterium OttesenSCG-928-F05]|nr:thymidine phosphorylase [Oscillospiraceae bacterium OttesenSCG-928-F05]
MRMYDLIMKKKRGEALSDAEIAFFVSGFTDGTIPDYQASALLMAICFTGMTEAETVALTGAMAASGDTVDLSAIPGVKVDKHSTGGVGDKTTLIIGPIVASLGVPVAKMSGRGLGHTGGTVDKLEAIPGLKTAFTQEDFLRIVRETGICVAGQSGSLAPADKKLYALRDVTGTVDSLPLIAASVMSKKLAAGADKILLDVKAGSGAFMKTVDDAAALARCMVDIGTGAGRETAALVTNMDIPLGSAVGNALEIIEVIEVLRGTGPADLTAVSLDLAAAMLALAGRGDAAHCRALAEGAIASGDALRKLREMVAAQGGDPAYIDTPARFGRSPVVEALEAPEDGYVAAIQSELCGLAACMLGAGRETETSVIDPLSGILLMKKPGDHVSKGDTLAFLHTAEAARVSGARETLLRAYSFRAEKPEAAPLVYAYVSESGVTRTDA